MGISKFLLCLFTCLHRSPLIPNLLRLQPDVFPGSAMMALRLLAFFTSWLRFHFTPVSVGRRDCRPYYKPQGATWVCTQSLLTNEG